MASQDSEEHAQGSVSDALFAELKERRITGIDAQKTLISLASQISLAIRLCRQGIDGGFPTDKAEPRGKKFRPSAGVLHAAKQVRNCLFVNFPFSLV